MNDKNNTSNQNQWDDNNVQSTGLNDNKPTKGKQGFAALDAAERSKIASKGGTTAHQNGTAHKWTAEEAAEAGRKGGQNSKANRDEEEFEQ